MLKISPVNLAKKHLPQLVFFGLLLIAFGLCYLQYTYYFERHIVNKIKTSSRPIPSHFDAKIVLVGDSMTEYLGNLEEFGYFLNRYYPMKNFLLLNYGYSSTNVLSLPNRLKNNTFHNNRTYQAIDNIDFDLILIESFGNNPLTEYPLDQGLKLQNQALDDSIAEITKTHPKSSIVFVATIAPSQKYYGVNAVNLSPEKRKEWANIRSAYVLNHIAYAKSHNIPVIDIYHRSLMPWGDGNLEYINKLDHIHPSLVGIFFIDDLMAQFIHKNKLL